MRANPHIERSAEVVLRGHLSHEWSGRDRATLTGSLGDIRGQIQLIARCPSGRTVFMTTTSRELQELVRLLRILEAEE